MIKAWRIVKAKHADSAFKGAGCQFASGRWHDLMVPVVYCSDSQALAVLETFVHVHSHAKHIHYVVFELAIPKVVIVDVMTITALPQKWRQQPTDAATQKIGSDWVRSQASAVLRVPSVIAPADSNYVISPHHPDFHRIVVGEAQPFSFDSRLWK